MINERLTIERLSEVLKNMQGYAERDRQLSVFVDGCAITERVDPTFIDCVSALAELKEYREAQPAGYHVIKECGAVGCSLTTLEEAENTRDFWNKNWTIKPYFYGPQLLTAAERDVAAERKRQQSTKGYSVEQDDTYIGGELAAAAISYIEPMEAESYWPADWHDDSFKPSDYRRNLVKAGALILAEIERIDRQEQAPHEQ